MLHPGWPAHLDGLTNTIVENNLSVQFVEGEGWVIAAGTYFQVALLNLDGQLCPGWPITFAQHDIWGIPQGPRLGDMDGDGLPEVVFMTADRDTFKHVRVYTFQGEYDSLLSRRWYNSRREDYLQSCPILVDLDQDNCMELMYLSQDSVNAVRGDGSNFPGFPWPTNEVAAAVFGGLAVGIGEGWNASQPVVVWGTQHLLHARALNGDGALPGWPVELGNDKAYTPITLVPTEYGWIASVCDDSLHYAWDQDGQPLAGFPFEIPRGNPPSKGRPNDVIPADLDGNGTVDFLKRPFTPYLYAHDLQGASLENFPLLVSNQVHHDFVGGGEPAAVLRTAVSDSAYIFTMSYHSATNHLYGFHGTQLLPGFPVIHPTEVEPATNAVSPVALIPGPDDTVRIVMLQTEGLLAVYDLLMGETGGMTFEWQMDGNTSGGNRMYHPIPALDAVPEAPQPALPQTLFLGRPYPNPFNGSVRARLEIPAGGARLTLVDLMGREVLRQSLTPGRQTWSWTSEDNLGHPLASGLYFIHLSAPNGLQSTRKLLLIR